MRIDVVSIFPQYLAPLQLSLVGKAIEQGIVTLGVHDLRDAATDRHRTVDDAPYGGGPGMVMTPEPWGITLDRLVTDSSTIVVPTPSGIPFTQRIAEELAPSEHIVMACGRYEGIDDRVWTHYRTRAIPVRELSIGDYVLAGGEAAALVMIEAMIRLLPGVLGNDESAVDDSFGRDRVNALEGPRYTRPRVWRDLAVPDILVSGDHAAIERWRLAQSEQQTRRTRPDLLPDPVEGA